MVLEISPCLFKIFKGTFTLSLQAMWDCHRELAIVNFQCEAVPLLLIPIAFSSFDVRSFRFSTSSSVLYPSAWKSSVYSSSSNPTSHASTLCCGRRIGYVRPNSVQILFHLPHSRAQFDQLVYAWNTATEWGWQETRRIIIHYTVDFQSHWYCNTLILGCTFF